MITLRQVIADIKNGKTDTIYMCAKSLWWTHLESDVINATELGKHFTAETIALGKLIITNKLIQCSPIGEQIIKNTNALKFIIQSQSNPQHYGKHGLQAFMKAHHQNNTKGFYNRWSKYNDLIDNERELKVVQIKK